VITVQETFNGPRDFPVSGKFFRLLSTVNPVDLDFLAEGGGISDYAKQVSTGYYGHLRFDRVRITTGANEQVKFVVSDDRAGIDAISVGLTKPSTINTVPDVALGAGVATPVLGIDASRQQALITNLAGNANAIRVGDANVGAARGVQVGVGQTITIAGSAAISAFSAGAQNVGVTVVKD